VRVELRRGEWIKRGTEVIGARTHARIVKNKVAPPFRRAEFDIIFGVGVPREGCVLDEAVRLGIVEKSGSWYAYGEERLGQGRENSIQYLEQNPQLLAELENKVREQAGLHPAPADTAVVDETSAQPPEDEATT
jgi:recombination protein RecA